MKSKTKFKQTEIGKIPEDWEVKSLNQVYDIFLGGTPKTSVKEYWDGNIKWASAKDVAKCNSRYIYETEKKITEEGIKNSAAKILPKNTAVITSRGTVGKIALLSELMSFNQTCYGLTSKEGNDSLFLYYKLLYLLDKLLSVSYGTVFNTITMSTFHEVKEGFPNTIEEQISIASILSSLDAKIELNNKINNLLEAVGQTIFKKWFVDESKKEWKISTIGEELKTILGGTPDRTNPDYWNGNINWINSGAINDFPIINPSEKISELGLNKSATQLMPEKTIVLPFVISFGKPVAISILGIKTAGNQSVLGIVPNEKFSSSFIYYYIQNQKNEIYSSVTGGAQQHINKRNVDETEIIIPDKKTLEKFNLVVEPLINLILKNSFQNQKLSQIRDLLLPKLMSGEIRVK